MQGATTVGMSLKNDGSGMSLFGSALPAAEYVGLSGSASPSWTKLKIRTTILTDPSQTPNQSKVMPMTGVQRVRILANSEIQYPTNAQYPKGDVRRYL